MPPSYNTVESDDDLQPHELLDRFIQLKSRLHQMRPDLTEVGTNRGKKQKARQGPIIQEHDPITASLVRRIRALESDILFDGDEANEKWAELRIQLVREKPREKKPSRGDLQMPSLVGEATGIEATTDQSSGEEQQGMDLSDFFSSLPEEGSINATIGKSGMAIKTADGITITIRDFGKWNGVSPRRIFEAACKARFVAVFPTKL